VGGKRRPAGEGWCVVKRIIRDPSEVTFECDARMRGAAKNTVTNGWPWNCWRESLWQTSVPFRMPSVAIGSQPGTLKHPDPSRRETRARVRSPVWWPAGRPPDPTAHQRVSLAFSSSATIISSCKIVHEEIFPELSSVSASCRGVQVAKLQAPC